MKVGIIRCMQTEDYCPGTTDFYAVKKKVGAFADLEGDLKIRFHAIEHLFRF